MLYSILELALKYECASFLRIYQKFHLVQTYVIIKNATSLSRYLMNFYAETLFSYRSVRSHIV